MLAGVELPSERARRVQRGRTSAVAEDAAESVDRQQDGHDLVIDMARAREGGLKRGGKGAEDTGQKKLLEDDAAAPGRADGGPQQRKADEKENKDRRGGEGRMQDQARAAFRRREIHREAEDHGLRSDQAGEGNTHPLGGAS